MCIRDSRQPHQGQDRRSERHDKLREVVWYGEVVEQREVDVHVRLELLVEAVELVDDLRRLSFSTGRSVVTRSGDN